MMDTRQRFYPAEPDDVWDALDVAALGIGKVKNRDEYARSMTIATRASGFSWGSNLSAQVQPAQGGSTVNVYGVKKVLVNIGGGSTDHKDVMWMLDRISEVLRRLEEN